MSLVDRSFAGAAIALAFSLFAVAPAAATPEICASHWIERNKPFADAGLCVDTPLWRAAFPQASCAHTSGSEISLPDDVSQRLAEIRKQENQLGCRIDSVFDSPQAGARSLWVEVGDIASIFSAKDGYANLRDAPGAQSGAVIGRLDDGGQAKILERIQSPDNGALWFRISYADNIGRLREAFVHYGSVFPRREIVGSLSLARNAHTDLVSVAGIDEVPDALRVRFWVDGRPGDIWPLFSEQNFARPGNAPPAFSIAFGPSSGWRPGEMEAMASTCEWKSGKRRADCAGKAGSFRIMAVRDEATGRLVGLAMHLDSPQTGDGSIVASGFAQPVKIAATTGTIQLAIPVEGLRTVKSGQLQEVPADSPAAKSDAISGAKPLATPTAAPAASATPAAAANIPEAASDALVDFDEMMSLTE